MKKRLLYLLLIFSFIFITSCVQENDRKKEPSEPAYVPLSPDEGQQQPEQTSEPEIKHGKPIKAMIFEVTIPENRLDDDTVWIYVRQIPYKMGKIEDSRYSIILNEIQLFGEGYVPQRGDKIRYRYSRNRYDFHTAEYLDPTPEEPDRDTNNYFWTKHGREIAYESGKIQQDTIERWRWFPKEGMIAKTTSLEPSGEFLPRVSNIKFRSGQTIEDLYVEAFHDFFNSTAQHLREQGFTWVELDPPWQWAEVNGMPKVINDFANAPNYPDDKTFLEELRAYKKEGLHVLIAPQVCCTALNDEDKPKEWWDAYFDETKKFLVHFAALAEQENADAFMYAVPSWNTYPASVNVEEEWRAIFSSIKQVFSGEVGEMIWILGPDVAPRPSPIPDTAFVKWDDQLDFFMVATEFPLSTNDNPTDKQLKIGAENVLDGVKVFYDTFQKPIIIRNGYFNVKHSWKGQTFYQIDSIPWISDPEAALQQSKYEFNTEDHARTVNSMFQAISERPWIIGYFHFGYTHWEDPLSPWMSIRGKPAEDIWKKWNEVIYDSTS